MLNHLTMKLVSHKLGLFINFFHSSSNRVKVSKHTIWRYFLALKSLVGVVGSKFKTCFISKGD